MQLADIETPALVLDRDKLDRNARRMHEHVQSLGAALRPHVKTAKSIDVVRRVCNGVSGGITVSTLKEAEYFFAHGIRDIVYAVGIAPTKFAHVFDLRRRGCELTVVLDNVAAARALASAAERAGLTIPVLIELDVDGHRSGVEPGSPLLIELGSQLHQARGTTLRGVLTHAGESYNQPDTNGIADMAERERSGAVGAAQRLRAAGFDAPVVSVGSTPTATFARNLSGVTEVRVGVYMFHDLVMAGLGVCTCEDIALSVLVSVIGHQVERGQIITDGGWMALSRDRGTSQQRIDQGYGLVFDMAGHPTEDDLIVSATNQEHGILSRRDRRPIDPARYPVGTLLRVLPNHACATAAQHPHYNVVATGSLAIQAQWSRFNGW